VLRRSDVELGYDLGDLELTGTAAAVTLFRPGPAKPEPGRARGRGR